MTAKEYRDCLTDMLNILEELTEAPSPTATRDSFIHTLHLQFEITRELYRLDKESANKALWNSVITECKAKETENGGQSNM